MQLERVEVKSEACFRQRGFDFVYAARAFFDPDRLVQADPRGLENRGQILINFATPPMGSVFGGRAAAAQQTAHARSLVVCI